MWSFFFGTVMAGLDSLRNQLLRSVLTALGIIFGVAAVITMVGIGEGRTAEALRQIEQLGASNIIVRSVRPPESASATGGRSVSFINRYGLTYADLDAVRTGLPQADLIVPVKEFGGQVIRNGQRQTSQSFGTTPDLAQVLNLRLAAGRYLTADDLEQRTQVCVIGSEVARQFFRFEDPIGQTIRIDAQSLTVVGLLAPIDFAGGAGSALVGRDLNRDIHAPITTVRNTFGDIVSRRTSGNFQTSEVHIAEIYARSTDRDRVIADAQILRRLLDQRRPGLPDVQLIVPYELLGQARRAALAGQIVSGAIAGISLLVGGIGIMNIMLATVTERTREIGIRRALGATRGHILSQFLVETGVLSAAGGLIGVAIGVGLSLSLTGIVPKLYTLPVVGALFPTDATLPVIVSEWAVLLAFSVALATGLIFGIYPARRASIQDPIVALRHD